jgi:hypothetical protein|tara:strand:- start:435 stop:1214 length:780 start_codon:yes stop_codon:yes gene_type:complete
MALGFVKLNRSEQLSSMIATDPQGYALLSIIALRTNRQTGYAMVGDWKNMGFSSRGAYRNTLNRLLRANHIAIKTTNKGTLVTLANTDFFDVNLEEASHQASHQTSHQSQKKQATNKNLLKTRKKEGCISDQQFRDFFEEQVHQLGVPKKQIREWLAIRKKNTHYALSLQLKYLHQVVAMGFTADKVFEILLGNEWIGIKPKETYFINELRGTIDERDELNDISWQNDQHDFHDVPSNLSKLAKRPERVADKSREKIVG